MGKINLSMVEPVAPVKSKTIYSCENGEVFINENGKVFFKYLADENPDKLREISEQIESLKKERATAETYEESTFLDYNISKLEKSFEYWKWWWRWWKYFVMLSSKQISDFQDCLQNSREPENIWSALRNSWLSFGNDFWNNNLTKLLTDKQLDYMSVEQATSLAEWKATFPRTREQE